MRILVAGATGAIGQPLIDSLIFDGHEVFGLTRSDERAEVLAAKGAKAVRIDLLNKEDVFSRTAEIKPEIVVDMLTSLPKEYTPEAMEKAAVKDAKIRREGGGNLQEAAEKNGVRRYVVQSCGFWYAPGVGLADENTPFAFDATPSIAARSRIYAEIERRVLQSDKIEGVALRFGFFYGPGTWFHIDGDEAKRVKEKKFPIIGEGDGVWNFIHIKDAAKSVSQAVYCSPGAYNIVNNRPVQLREWLPAFARYVGAPPPPYVSLEEAEKTLSPDTIYYATKLRGVSNNKAKREFNFEPRSFDWLL
jgi:nucleoside-diphosphate-sugar epimerase